MQPIVSSSTMAFTAEALLVVVAVALLVIQVSRLLWSQPKLKLPPGPRAWPVVGSLHLLGTRPHWNLHKLAQKHGPVMSVWLGQRLCIVATSPEAAKEFLKLQDANFSSRPSIHSADLVMPGDMVLHSITPVTRHLRKILMAELMSGKRLDMSSHIRSDEMASMLQRLFSEAPAPTELNAQLNIMSSNVLSRMILNRRFLGEEDPNLNQLIQDFMEIVAKMNICFSRVYLGDFFNLPKWFDPQGLRKQFKGLRGQMDWFYQKLIDQHLEERQKKPLKDNEHKTLLDILLEEQQSSQTGVTEENVKGIIWDLLSAGTSTTTETTEWAISEVLHNPKVASNARSELDLVVGRDRIVLESDIPNLKYIQAVIKETLRLHPPVPLLIPHQNKTATTAFGYDIPAQTRLLVNVWAIGRSWEKPLEFVPERFLEGAATEATTFQGQHYEFLPFGSGRRICPGMGLAYVAVHFQVASLLHAFEWVPKGLTLTEARPALTLPKSDPLVAVMTPRLPLHCYQG